MIGARGGNPEPLQRDFVVSAQWYSYAIIADWPISVSFPICYGPEDKLCEIPLQTNEPLAVAALKKYARNAIMRCEEEFPDTYMGQIQVFSYSAQGHALNADKKPRYCPYDSNEDIGGQKYYVRVVNASHQARNNE